MARQHNDEQSAPSPEGIVGLNIRERATSKSPILGILPRYAVIDIGEKSGDQKWARIAKIVDGDIAPAQKGGSIPNEARQGWVFLGELEQETGIPERLDQTYVLPKPYPIKAGELIGHLGEYQRPCEASRLPPQPNRPLLHLEVFSGDEVPAFIEASRKRAAQLANSDKTLFVIETGATLCSPAEPDQMLAADAGVMPLKGETAGKGPWVQVHPMRTQIIERAGLTFSAKDGQHGSYMVGGQRAYFTGRFFGATNQEMTDDESVAREKGYGRREVQIPEPTSLWIERRHLGGPGGAPAWRQFPLQLSKTMPPASGQPRTLTKAELNRVDESRKAVDGQGATWWQVDVGDANGRAVRGWVREKGHPKTGWKSPWDWPGFVTEAETAAPADLMRCQLHRLDAAQNAQEANEFKTAAARVSEGPLLTQLREILDAQDQKDGLISSQDLRKALQQPWLAERLGKLIIRHESEWGGTAAKWDAMDELMLDGLPDWQAEKQRIEKLKIWDGLQGVEGFPASSNVYHFHPLGLTENFLTSTDLIADYIKMIGNIISGGEGNYESYNTGTKNVPGGKVGHSFLNPKPGTVTGKTIDEIVATDSKSGSDSDRLFATGKYQTTISTLKSGKIKLGLTGKEKYDAQLQERFFSEYLFNKAGGGKLAAFVTKGEGTIDDAQYSASKEWASISVPKGLQIEDGSVSDGTMSYYQGSANSSSSDSTKKLRDALVKIENSRK